MEMKWYAAYTEPNWEKEVTAILNRKKIIHYCPIEVNSKKEGKKVNLSFSGYVFVKVPETEIKQIRQIKGIKYFMYWLDKPATVTEFEINLIKDFLNEHSYVRIEKKDPGFNSITLSNGKPKENEAKLIHLNDNKIKATLPSLRMIMIAEFEKSVMPLTLPKNLTTLLKPKFKYRIAGNI